MGQAELIEEIHRILEERNGSREVMDAREAADFLRIPYQQFRHIAPTLPRFRTTERRYVYYRQELLNWLLSRRVED